ncbi:MAG: hypothetical protein ACC655_11335 [Rhodothermia bacterium]
MFREINNPLQSAMKMLFKFSSLLFATLISTTGCAEQGPQTTDHSPPVQLEYFGRVQGDIQYYGLNSSVETWTDFDDDGKPTRLGITISESFVDRNSETLSAKLDDDQRQMNTGSYFDLELPEHPGIPFRHAYFSFHPMGHVPPGIYNMPHFDFHFYLVPSGARKAMAPEAVGRAMEPVADGYLPASYRAAAKYNNFYWPYMGTHFVSDHTDEIKITEGGDIEPGGERFDQTFIYGTFGGEVVFFEPMVSSWFLETIKEADRGGQAFDVELPVRFKRAGYYPTKYRIAYANDPMTGLGYYTVSIEDLVWKEAS